MMELKIHTNPKCYFVDQVQEASKSLDVQVDEYTSFYLVNLLIDFINPDKMSVQIGERKLNPMDTPLALLLAEIMEIQDNNTKYRLLKLVGDYSLYFSGYFQDYFNRKSFSLNYYISMGEKAFQLLAQFDEKTSQLYTTLEKEFRPCVDIVAKIAASSPIKQNQNLLAVYDRWLQHPSDQLLKTLQESGIQPVPLSGKKAS